MLFFAAGPDRALQALLTPHLAQVARCTVAAARVAPVAESGRATDSARNSGHYTAKRVSGFWPVMPLKAMGSGEFPTKIRSESPRPERSARKNSRSCTTVATSARRTSRVAGRGSRVARKLKGNLFVLAMVTEHNMLPMLKRCTHLRAADVATPLD